MKTLIKKIRTILYSIAVLLVFSALLFVFQITRRVDINVAGAITFSNDLLPAGNLFSLGLPNAPWYNLFLKDFLKVGTIPSPPTTAAQGSIYFDTTFNAFRGCAVSAGTNCSNTNWFNLGETYWQPSSSNLYSIGTINIGIGTMNPDEELTVSGGAIRTDRSYKDIFAWQTNSRYSSNLSLAYNMSGFGGGVVSPGTNFATSTGWSAYDASSTGGYTTRGFTGAVFDGRYVYFVPFSNSVIVLRYDATQSINASSSWSAYNALNIPGMDLSTRFQGAVFDGRYVYFVPYSNSSGQDGIVLRYDTTQSFTTSGSWSAYDAGTTNGLTTKGFVGAVFDGRYVYFVPYANGSVDGIVLRYDTTQSFTTSGSWSAYDAGNTSGLNTKGFQGAVFDGRYVYFVPYLNSSFDGIVLRYDTTGSFTTSGSWSAYDAGTTNGLTTKGFQGAVFDGRYVYFVPSNNGLFDGIVLRYDTTGSFTASGSWSAYDAGNTNGLITKGFIGAVFDGRYVYFVPYTNGTADGIVLRYDTTGSFTVSGSWSAYDAGTTNGLTAKGFQGAAFDGRYIYFVPHFAGLGLGGTVLRYDTGSPYPEQGVIQTARTPEIFINSTSSVGIGTVTPTYKFQVSGGDAALQNSGSGFVAKSPNGLLCERINLDNTSNVTTTVVACP